MTGLELLRFLEERGVHLSLEGERIRLNAPKGALTQELEDLVSARRQEIIEILLGRSGSSPEGRSIPRASRDQALPASPGQAGLWFLDQLTPGDSSYNIIHTTREYRPLDLSVRQRALNAVVARHEALRTTFREIEGLPHQVISPALVLSVPVQDLSSLPIEEREAEVRRITAEEARRPFDLAHGPLLRYQLLRLADDEWESVLIVHHIIFDGWSLSLFNRELHALHDALLAGEPSPLPDLSIQYADYAVWQSEELKGPKLQSQLEYWRHKLMGPLPVLALPCGRPRPVSRSPQGAVEYSFLPSELNNAVETLGRRHRATPFITYLAAFNTLLHRYSRQEDLLVGVPTAGRNHIETESLVGLFVNTLVLRTDISGTPSFTELLARVRKASLDAFSNQDLPFEELVSALRPERSSSHTPLFQVMFNLVNLDSDATPWDLDNGTAKFDLTLTLVPTGSGMQCVWEYSTDLFDSATVRLMAEHFETLLLAIVTDPERRISELPLMTEAERRQVLIDWNNTCVAYDKEATISSLFEAQAARMPDAVAVISEDGNLTYRELNSRANRLAHRLLALGIGRGSRVGVCLERSPEVWVTLLAVLRAGAGYVPLDPNYPHERLDFMLMDANVQALITQERLLERLPSHAATVVLVDSLSNTPINEPDLDLDSQPGPDDVAYVIYTSGSTGKPKGVEGTHRGVVNRLAWMWREYPFEPEEVACQKTSLSFVDSIWELFGPLLQGVPTLVVPDEVVTDPNRLVDLLEKRRVTRIVLVPSLLRVLLDAAPAVGARLAALRTWVSSGEVISADLARTFRAVLPRAMLLNLYGSSEVAADATFYEVKGGEASSIPIGRPIDNTQVYVLEPSLQPVPIGVPGEIYIGGDGLARGYLARPELTAERFVPNPFSGCDGSRLYRTGDLGLLRADGNLEFLGRLDDQVKVRGIRVELGEIESLLRHQAGVAEAVVVMRSFAQADERLVAYVTASAGVELRPAELRAGLKRHLPEYMLPATVMALASLPVTPSGKVDRLALPDPREESIEEADTIRARTETERRLAAIWQNLLGLQSLSIRDGFFDLGGYSLLAVRLFAAVEKEFGKRLPITTIFAGGGTIESLARVIDGGAHPSLWESLVPLQRGGTKAPFFCVHPVDGDVFWYLALAGHVGLDQPFYALRARGLDGVQEPHLSFEDAARDYIREIKLVQPADPYYLGGFSWGAMIAYEMAQQLQASGDDVAFFASIDSPPSKTDYYVVSWGPSFGLRWLRALPRRIWQFARWSPEIKFAIVRRKWEKSFASFRKITRLGHSTDRLPWDSSAFARDLGGKLFGEGAPAQHERVMAALHQASLEYEPKPFSGRVTLFRANEQPLFCSHDPLMDWGRLGSDGVDVRGIQGSHVSILKEPHVGQLGAALREALRTAEASSPGPQPSAQADTFGSVARAASAQASRSKP